MAVPRLGRFSLSLESGDRLSRAEFHRRYEENPEVRKAELIEGVVYVASPVRTAQHGIPEADLGAWLSLYRAAHPELRVAHNATVVLDADNEVQPDLILYVTEGGTTRLDDKGFLHGPPELVVEVAVSSASYDLHVKKHVYRRADVQEYLVLRVLDGAVDWFVREDDEFVALSPGAGSLIESRRFPGLRLDVPALLAGDLPRLLAPVATH